MVLLFSRMHPKQATTPFKSNEGQSLTHEESEDLEFSLFQLEEKVNAMDDYMLKKVDFISSQENIKSEMKKTMNGNKEGIEKEMNENKEEI